MASWNPPLTPNTYLPPYVGAEMPQDNPRFSIWGVTVIPVFGLAVRRESPLSKQHDHVEDSMIVAPLDRSLN